MTLLPLTTPTIVANLPVTTTSATQILKFDSMVEVDITIAAAGAYDYTITYDLIETTAGVVVTETIDNSGTAISAGQIHSEVPNLTWVVNPGSAGTFTYSIRITVNSTIPGNISAATANTRALNSIIFG